MRKDWAEQAAEEIYDGNDWGVEIILNVIVKHCPMAPDTAYMPVPRCDMCQHWKALTDMPGHGECQLLQQGNYARDWEARKAVAHGEDAVLITQASFGCVQWKNGGRLRQKAREQ